MAVLRLGHLYDAGAAVRPLGGALAAEGPASAGALHRHAPRHARHPRPAPGVERIRRRCLFHRRHDDVLGRASSRCQGYRTFGLSESETLARRDRSASRDPARMGAVPGVMQTASVMAGDSASKTRVNALASRPSRLRMHDRAHSIGIAPDLGLARGPYY